MDRDLTQPCVNEVREPRPITAAPPLACSPLKARFSAETAASLFKPWETARGILLGVSGGPDSVALMLLAAQWARGHVAPPPLYVATVDHGLRKESRGEAETVARWAAALALPHAILVWEGDKPKSKIQERAREARYHLLFEHASKIGADHVMTAHHADDQAETILFRLLRGSGVSGLAGMAPSRECDGLVLARPLLSCTKEDLVALCEERAHPFFIDPSNHDPVYARTRMRRLRGLLAEEGLDRTALLRLAMRASRAETALQARGQSVAASLLAERRPGLFKADISALADEPDEIFLRILADELKLIGGEQRVRLERLETLVLRLRQAMRDEVALKTTLGGAVLKLQCNCTLVIVREAPRRRRRENPLGVGVSQS